MICCIIVFNFVKQNYHYTNITSPESTNSILITEYDLPLNSEMIIYKQIFCCIYKKEIYKSTEFGFYPFFEEKAQYNWITENQVELKYTLDRTSDFSIAYIRNITFN